MRVLFLCDEPVWVAGLPWGFRQLGHEVRVVGILQRDSLLVFGEHWRPDLVVTIGWQGLYIPSGLDAIREMVVATGAKHVYWAVEDIQHHDRWSLPLVKRVQPDLVFTINDACIASYTRLGIPGERLEFACNPGIHCRFPVDHGNKVPLALVANTHESVKCFRRQSILDLVSPLVANKYSLAIWGRGWEKAKAYLGFDVPGEMIRGPMAYEQASLVYNAASIVLGIQNENRFPTQVTMRTFEILGSGAFLLASRTPAVQGLFKDRHHLVMSSSPQETRDLVDYYLVHPEEREVIARTGQAEVYARHTYAHRASQILEAMRVRGILSHEDVLEHQDNQVNQGIELSVFQPCVADASAYSAKPNDNLGNREIMIVGCNWYREKGWSTYRSFLSFGVRGLPPEARIARATLYLWANSVAGGRAEVDCCQVEQPWMAETITWNKQPFIGRKLASAAVPGHGSQNWYYWDVTMAVEESLEKGSCEISFCLLSQEKARGTLVSWSARNWSGDIGFTPQLVIVWSQENPGGKSSSY